jgi:hypothetical protein
MAIDYTALGVELNTDPIAYGYAEFIASGDDTALANMLNLPRTGTNGGPQQLQDARIFYLPKFLKQLTLVTLFLTQVTCNVLGLNLQLNCKRFN